MLRKPEEGDGRLMTDRILIETCAPTLAGLKTASLVNVPYESRECANREIRRLNRRFSEKGVRVIPLRYKGGRMLLYIYRPSLLKRDMENAGARALLVERGYEFRHADLGVAQLANRMRTQQEFPHEIGWFVGYAAEEGQGCIEHKYEGCTCVGEWRVYGDADAAKERFARHKRCKDVYRRLWESGKSVEALTVRTSA